MGVTRDVPVYLVGHCGHCRRGETSGNPLKTGIGNMKKTQVYDWHKTFLRGRETVENEPHAGRRCTHQRQNTPLSREGPLHSVLGFQRD
ncbi:hypothetical protein GE061_019954 [Apolygus lucorum]|uniref:Mos1 transposase HTH domain-containing protein n=1 Tax=Apolygus lucorum TaxID=248454 RepID=A0A8S9X9K8_APOLU|nr:hypothetical protein GE061_019954 [Apolygus lucorum]